MTLAELNRETISLLSASLNDSESHSVARIIMEDVIGASPIDIIIRGDRQLEPETVAKVTSIVRRINSGEPPQYVVGKARFMGMDFEVTPATLIPRPETEGLIDIIVDTYNGIKGLHIVDIGTGSGCIAIALARALPFAEVEAWDISSDALSVAERNAHNLGVKIDFRNTDVLNTTSEHTKYYDFIVSNPPYIINSERAEMEPRVLNYEPSTALFVPDSDPLMFYQAIARLGTDMLKPKGRLFFEINPLFAEDLTILLQSMGYDEIQIIRDYIGRKRIATAILQQ